MPSVTSPPSGRPGATPGNLGSGRAPDVTSALLSGRRARLALRLSHRGDEPRHLSARSPQSGEAVSRGRNKEKSPGRRADAVQDADPESGGTGESPPANLTWTGRTAPELVTLTSARIWAAKVGVTTTGWLHALARIAARSVTTRLACGRGTHACRRRELPCPCGGPSGALACGRAPPRTSRCRWHSGRCGRRLASR